MKTNRPMIYKAAAAQYAHDQVTAPPWGNPAQRLKTAGEVIAYWKRGFDPTPPGSIGPSVVEWLEANFSAAFQAGYRRALDDAKNGINGQDRVPPKADAGEASDVKD